MASNWIQNSFMNDNVYIDQDTPLAQISPGNTNINVKGIIVRKSFPRAIKKIKDRVVLNFTVRDSPTCFANVEFWGGSLFMENLSNEFSIGSAIEILSATANPKTINDEYRPTTPCSYYLTLNESKSSIKAMDVWSAMNFNFLINMPTVQNYLDYYYIQDIMCSGEFYVGEYTNLLAAVKKIGRVSEFKSKTGQDIKKLEIKLFDTTCNEILLIIWDEALIEYALSWVPKETIIFAVDLRIIFNKFSNLPAVVTTSKTLITMNPATKESVELHKYTETVIFPVEEIYLSYDISSVKETFNTQMIKNELLKKKDFMCIFVGLLSYFNVDANSSFIVTNRKKPRLDNTCVSGVPASLAYTNSNSENFYSIRINITDQYGTIDNCWLTNSAAERILDCTADEFLNCTVEYLTKLKWNYLFEKCSFVLKIGYKMNDDEMKAVIKILSLDLVK